ncbi:unnamed protein product [Symbiodinium sp. CCMP2456]|nr:unnamed protein product [Symbiodinium sp. CCMP2456]
MICDVVAEVVVRLVELIEVVGFQCEGSDDRIAEFELKLMQIESERMEIPEQHYKVIARLPSSEFQKICRDLKEFVETLQLSGSKEGLKFQVKGDIGSGNVLLMPRESEKPQDRGQTWISLLI